MAETIDFWFSVGSTYTYLSVMRLQESEAESGLAFRWRPFSVRALMMEQDNVPFRGKPIKTAYMWRDIERRAAMYGIPARLPAPWPLTEFDLANKVAVLARAEGWCEDYVRHTYRRWFEHGEEPGLELHLSDALREIGQDPRRVLDAAGGDAVARAYAEATDEARGLSLFGSPSFVVDGEVFWGDDRLEDAIGWAKKGNPA